MAIIPGMEGLEFGSYNIGGSLSNITTIGFWIIATLLGLGLVGGLIWYYFFYIRRYNILVEIHQLRQGKPLVIFDKGGFMNIGGANVFRLRKLRKNIQPPSFSSLMHYIKNPDISEAEFNSLPMEERFERFLTPKKKGTVLYLIQHGTEDFHAWIPELSPEDRTKMRVTEGDTALWSVGKMRMNRDLFAKKQWQDLIMQLAPYALFAVSMVLSLMLVYIVMDKFSVLQDVATSLQATANVMKESATILASSAPT